MRYKVQGDKSFTALTDDYIDAFRKANRMSTQPQTEIDKDLMSAFYNRLPVEVQDQLNNITEVRSLTSVDTLREVAKRYEGEFERRILQTGNQKQSATDLAKAIADMNEGLKETLEKKIKELWDNKNNDNKASLAVARVWPSRHVDNPSRFRKDYREQSNQQPYHYSRPGAGSYRQAWTHRYEAPTQGKMLEPHYERPASDQFSVARANYEAKYGPIPGPCHYCQGNHLNKHCPINPVNLNRQG